MVAKVRVCFYDLAVAVRRWRTQATTVFLWTSRPAQRACKTSIGKLPGQRGVAGRRTTSRQEQFALRAPRGAGGDRVGFEQVESSRGRARFVCGLETPNTKRPSPGTDDRSTITPLAPIFMRSGEPNWIMRIRFADSQSACGLDLQIRNRLEFALKPGKPSLFPSQLARRHTLRGSENPVSLRMSPTGVEPCEANVFFRTLHRAKSPQKATAILAVGFVLRFRMRESAGKLGIVPRWTNCQRVGATSHRNRCHRLVGIRS